MTLEEMKEHPAVTVGQVVEQLLKLPQDQPLVFNIRQYNKTFGKQVMIHTHPQNLHIHIGGSYGGACINLSLPTPAIICKWPEK